LMVDVLGRIRPVEKFFCAAGSPVAVSNTGLIAVARVLAWDKSVSTRSLSYGLGNWPLLIKS
jgi:hypothetical protein